MPDVRARLRAAVPAGYRWWRHTALVAAFAAAGAWVAGSRLVAPAAGEWALLGGMLLAINAGEYVSHRWQMHVRRFPLAVYRRHVDEHHVFFSHERMGIDAWADLHWVLFPPWALPLLVAGVLPFFAALWLLAGPNVAWLLLLAVFVYYGLYEIAHVMTHLPDEHALGRHPIVGAVARHHRIHHDPARMRRWNFNFAIPVCDRLFGTAWRAENAVAERRDSGA